MSMTRVFCRCQSNEPQTTVPYTRRWKSGSVRVSSRVPDTERCTRARSSNCHERARYPVDRPEDLLGGPFLGWCRLSTKAKLIPADTSARRGGQVVREDLAGTPGQLPAVVGPPARPPVPVAAGLGREQVQQRIAVSRVAGGHAPTQGDLVELRAGLVHRDQHLVVAANPGDVAGPAAPVHVEPVVFATQVRDHRGEPTRPVARGHSLPDPGLE